MHTLRLLLALGAVATAALALGGPGAFAQKAATPFDALAEGKVLHGFRTTALYLNDANRPMGARFVHERTGFVLDVLQIQSVPQGFIWVNSFPTSDMGEPHTQEHLLLGKGNRGRYVATLEDMSLSESSAFTQQWRTCYSFNTAGGPEVYYDQFQHRLDALLHPDYTDEEIRREVCNFGVTENPADSSLRLEEKGTVYNEMVSTFERGWTRSSRDLDIAVYGKDHPLAFVSGGLPAAIRQMHAEDIRLFHRDHYRLDNMGMVGSFPKEMSVDDILTRTSDILDKLQPGSNPPLNIMTEAKLPKPSPAPAGSIYLTEFPASSDQQPGAIVYAWPAVLEAGAKDEILMGLFIDNMAGDESSNLYKRFIDTKTREMDLGAQGVFGWMSTDQGHPIYMGIDEIPPAQMTKEKIAEIRGKIVDEIAKVASWKDGSKELAEFNARLKNRIIGERRSLAKFVNTPPGFGFRGTGSGWLDQLTRLDKVKGFRKSVTMKGELDAIEAELAGGKNIWRNYIASWHLTDAVPVAAAMIPKPELIKKESDERKARVAAEVARLKSAYGVASDQAAILRYKAEYDSTSEALDRLAAGTNHPRFIDSPPMTIDDQLDYKVTNIGDVPMVSSTFDNMTSATTGLALHLWGVPEDEYVYLSTLPTLLTGVGLYENGKALSYDQMTQRQREEILGLSAYFSTNFRTHRAELVVRGAGNDPAEAVKSIAWMKRVLLYPDWRPENLSRIRDLVDQTLAGLRGTMQGREEAWVNNPAGAYRAQGDKLILATESFLTRTHNAHRLRWLLKDAGAPADRDAISAYLGNLAAAGSQAKAPELKALLAAIKGDKDAGAVPAALEKYADQFRKLPAGARATALEAAEDLGQTLTDLPEGSLAADWRYLCLEMRHDLLVPPAQALEAMNKLRKRILTAGSARLFMIGSRTTQERLASPVTDLVSILTKTNPPALPASNEMVVKTRLLDHAPDASKPVFVGLVNPSSGSGVFLNSAPLTGYQDTSREGLLRYLASKVYSGQGAHSLFMKTWGSGLAYSNGVGSSPGVGRMSYYAERCPELPQTMRFVIDQVKNTPRDTTLADYCIAAAFQEFRSASSYESRGESMAADLADGITPDLVRGFRAAILNLRTTPKLIDLLYDRVPEVYNRVLPGFGGTNPADVAGGIYYVIGPEKQLALYEQYLQNTVGRDTKLYRLYPRDYWITLENDALGMTGDGGNHGGN